MKYNYPSHQKKKTKERKKREKLRKRKEVMIDLTAFYKLEISKI
jgi:hypothetical protein